MFLDLDGFKKINDTFGHGVGDKSLCRTAERLQRVLPPDAFLARLGGDEFSVMLRQPDELTELEALATRLIAAVGKPHHFGGDPTTVGVSVGIAANQRGDYDDIVRHADSAMYAAKQSGRNRWQYYRPSREEGRDERRPLESDLRQALDRHEIFVMFQPIVDAQSGLTTTVEALARWTHPTLGPISPDVFIPIAEESGLIVELGRQILEQSCRAARDWPFRLAVNLSPAQFWCEDLVGDVMATLAQFDFPPTRLKFEITETYLLSRPEAADAVIRGLRRHGIRIALDDFGTGFASIGYLRRFQFDLVKIDRSLVEAVAFIRLPPTCCGRSCRCAGHLACPSSPRASRPRNRRPCSGTTAANISKAGISDIRNRRLRSTRWWKPPGARRRHATGRWREAGLNEQVAFSFAGG